MIKLQDVTFAYAHAGHKVFSDFNLELSRGRVYGLLGKNGTGKSTLLYLLSGLLHAQKGHVLLNGTETRLRRTETLRELFIVPEEYDLPAMTLERYVRLHRPFYPRFSDEVLERCLESFDLPRSMRIGALSMGQKKKIYMSFALAAGTPLLLMDEPTNGLDIPSKTQFRRVVAENMTDDRTLIVSTHQVHDVEQLLDHILILSSDGLLMNKSTAEIAEEYAFELRQPGQLGPDVLYSEPTPQGHACLVSRRHAAETPVNIELLFNAVVEKGLR